MPIEFRQTKRSVAYRVVLPVYGPDGATVTKSFRTKAAAESWEREMLEAEERRVAAPPVETRSS